MTILDLLASFFGAIYAIIFLPITLPFGLWLRENFTIGGFRG